MIWSYFLFERFVLRTGLKQQRVNPVNPGRHKAQKSDSINVMTV